MSKQRATSMPAEDFVFKSRRFQARTFAVLNMNTHIKLKAGQIYIISTKGIPVSDILPYSINSIENINASAKQIAKINSIATKLAHNSEGFWFETVKRNILNMMDSFDLISRGTRTMIFESLKDQDLWLRHQTYGPLWYSIKRIHHYNDKKRYTAYMSDANVVHRNYDIGLYGLINRVNRYKAKQKALKKRKKVGVF